MKPLPSPYLSGSTGFPVHALLLALLFVTGITSAAPGDITTLAGNGTEEFSGDDGPAGSAGLAIPNRVAFDNQGNLFILDTFNRRIRKVDPSTGTISTFAFSGNQGNGGDGGPAIDASAFFLRGLAIDRNNDVFVSDDNLNSIRKIDSGTGTIATIAGAGTGGFSGDGGLAISAEFDQVAGIALDSRGNLYVADRTNHRIRRIDGTTGIVTTVAGNGTAALSGDGGPAINASLDEPRAVLIDLDGNLLIADAGNFRIRKVNLTSGTITTIAGNTERNDGDGGPASDANFRQPAGLAMDDVGNLFVTDSLAHVVRRIDGSTNIISTIAGTGSAGFTGDGGPAAASQLFEPIGLGLDPSGNLFIADAKNNRIRVVEGAGVRLPSFNNSARLAQLRKQLKKLKKRARLAKRKKQVTRAKRFQGKIRKIRTRIRRL